MHFFSVLLFYLNDAIINRIVPLFVRIYFIIDIFEILAVVA